MLFWRGRPDTNRFCGMDLLLALKTTSSRRQGCAGLSHRSNEGFFSLGGVLLARAACRG